MQRLVAARWPVTLAFAALLVVIWQLVASRPGVPAYVYTPGQVVSAFAHQVRGQGLWSDTAATLGRALPGFAIGATAGVLAGLLAGVSRAFEDIADTLVSATYPLPKISLFPLFVVWLGFTDKARILVIAVSAFYPSFINSLAGTRSIDPRMLMAARNFEAGRVRTFTGVVVRATMPAILTGLRLSLALSFVLAYATEVIGSSSNGLGLRIQNGFTNLQYGPMYAGMVMFAILGFGCDLLLKWVGGRMLRGQRLELGDRG